MFLVILKYEKSINEVMRYLDDHMVFLEKYYELNKFICSGRQEQEESYYVMEIIKKK